MSNLGMFDNLKYYSNVKLPTSKPNNKFQPDKLKKKKKGGKRK